MRMASCRHDKWQVRVTPGCVRAGLARSRQLTHQHPCQLKTLTDGLQQQQPAGQQQQTQQHQHLPTQLTAAPTKQLVSGRGALQRGLQALHRPRRFRFRRAHHPECRPRLAMLLTACLESRLTASGTPKRRAPPQLSTSGRVALELTAAPPMRPQSSLHPTPL